MRLLTIFLFSIVVSLVISTKAIAQWFESTGQATIYNSNKKSARNKAIENALKKTLLVAGASVSSVQQVVNGLLTKDEVNIRATGMVNSFEIINEKHSDDMIEVTIRADIFPQQKQCFSEDYRKTLLITKSHLRHREQANIGKLYELNTSISQQLDELIKVNGQYLQSKVNIYNKTSFSRLHQSQAYSEIKSLVTTLASNSDSQFVLFSEITDLSLQAADSSAWQFWQGEKFNRHFNLSLFLYDGINGELIFDKSYRSAAPWNFAPRDTVNPANDEFWQSLYGQNITRMLKEIALDIDERLMCQPTQGKILNIEGNELLINLGKRHGVQINDKFSLLTHRNFLLANGKTHTGFNISPYQLKVLKISRDSAVLAPENNEQLGNIQIHDLAVKY